MHTISGEGGSGKRLREVAERTFSHGCDDVAGSSLIRQNDKADMWVDTADFAK